MATTGGEIRSGANRFDPSPGPFTGDSFGAPWTMRDVWSGVVMRQASASGAFPHGYGSTVGTNALLLPRA